MNVKIVWEQHMIGLVACDRAVYECCPPSDFPPPPLPAKGIKDLEWKLTQATKPVKEVALWKVVKDGGLRIIPLRDGLQVPPDEPAPPRTFLLQTEYVPKIVKLGVRWERAVCLIVEVPDDADHAYYKKLAKACPTPPVVDGPGAFDVMPWYHNSCGNVAGDCHLIIEGVNPKDDPAWGVVVIPPTTADGASRQSPFLVPIDQYASALAAMRVPTPEKEDVGDVGAWPMEYPCVVCGESTTESFLFFWETGTKVASCCSRCGYDAASLQFPARQSSHPTVSSFVQSPAKTFEEVLERVRQVVPITRSRIAKERSRSGQRGTVSYFNAHVAEHCTLNNLSVKGFVPPQCVAEDGTPRRGKFVLSAVFLPDDPDPDEPRRGSPEGGPSAYWLAYGDEVRVKRARFTIDGVRPACMHCAYEQWITTEHFKDDTGKSTGSVTSAFCNKHSAPERIKDAFYWCGDFKPDPKYVEREQFGAGRIHTLLYNLKALLDAGAVRRALDYIHQQSDYERDQ